MVQFTSCKRNIICWVLLHLNGFILVIVHGIQVKISIQLRYKWINTKDVEKSIFSAYMHRKRKLHLVKDNDTETVLVPRQHERIIKCINNANQIGKNMSLLNFFFLFIWVVRNWWPLFLLGSVTVICVWTQLN